MKKKLELTKARSFNELLDVKYGPVGSKKRNLFEESAQKFFVSELLRDARKEAKLTQKELAERIGTKKSYISRIENGRANITVETLFRIFETGLNRKVGIIIS